MNFPILSSLILLPIIGSFFILFIKSTNKDNQSIKLLALFASFANFLLSLYLWYQFDTSIHQFQFIENKKWLIGLINYKVGVDGISILFILLTTLIIPLCIISVNHTIKHRTKEFLIAILLMESLMIGVFCSLDLVIFYLFFEGCLIPMFLIIGIWGGTRRVYSAFKFFLYTLLGSVLMLIAIISIYWITGTTDFIEIYNQGIAIKYQKLLWLAFFSSFAVKTPMWPVHTWLPDAHVEAPTGGSVVLAAVMLKMGGYGFLRFSLPITPDGSLFFADTMIVLSLIAIVYIGFVALVQEDMKKLIAYSSISHMGFVTLGFFIPFGIFAATNSNAGAVMGIEGAIMQMISHGFISAAMFLCVGVMYDRLHSRMIKDYGGVVNSMPYFAAFMMLFAMANSGLPGTSGFVGEFLVILSSFKVNFWIAFIAALTLILGAAYTLWMYKRVVFGEAIREEVSELKDIDSREAFILILLAGAILLFGIWPAPLFDVMHVSIEQLTQHISQTKIL